MLHLKVQLLNLTAQLIQILLPQRTTEEPITVSRTESTLSEITSDTTSTDLSKTIADEPITMSSEITTEKTTVTDLISSTEAGIISIKPTTTTVQKQTHSTLSENTVNSTGSIGCEISTAKPITFTPEITSADANIHVITTTASTVAKMITDKAGILPVNNATDRTNTNPTSIVAKVTTEEAVDEQIT